MKNIPGFGAERSILKQRNYQVFPRVFQREHAKVSIMHYAGLAGAVAVNGVIQPAFRPIGTLSPFRCHWVDDFLYCCTPWGDCRIVGTTEF